MSIKTDQIKARTYDQPPQLPPHPHMTPALSGASLQASYGFRYISQPAFLLDHLDTFSSPHSLKGQTKSSHQIQRLLQMSSYTMD